MPDIVMSCNVDADATTVWQAISTPAGVTGWFTARAEIDGSVGGHHLLSFPDMPAPWDLRIEDSRPSWRLTLSVQAGPPEWEATTMTYQIADRPGGGVVLNFDHNDFATTDGARAWTIGWATKMLALKKYAETGQRDPFFT